MELPQNFLESYKAFCIANYGIEDYEAFLEAMDSKPKRALRLNGLKVSKENLGFYREKLQAFFGENLSQVPWSQYGFYISEDCYPGREFFYDAGLYYLQEASAQLPAVLLSAKKNEAVLDLCAAPGGKSTQIAADLKGSGLLWSNDISEKRARILLRNLELQGVRSLVVSSADAECLSKSLVSCFDAIALDAPCSGEGMMQRDSRARESRANYDASHYTPIQNLLLEQADKMLKKGGRMVYSTCTFNIEENEAMIDSFLKNHPDYFVLPAKDRLPSMKGIRSGIIYNSNVALEGACRIFPQDGYGDGHFAICLQKGIAEPESDLSLIEKSTLLLEEASSLKKSKKKKRKNQNRQNTKNESLEITKAIEACLDFLKTILKPEFYEIWEASILKHAYLQGDALSILPDFSFFSAFDGEKRKNTDFYSSENFIKFLKKGTFLGTVKFGYKGTKFYPSQSLALCLSVNEVVSYISLNDDSQIEAFLNGQTLSLTETEISSIEMNTPYFLLGAQNLPLGFAKHERLGVLKNLRPKTWQRA